MPFFKHKTNDIRKSDSSGFESSDDNLMDYSDSSDVYKQGFACVIAEIKSGRKHLKSANIGKQNPTFEHKKIQRSESEFSIRIKPTPPLKPKPKSAIYSEPVYVNIQAPSSSGPNNKNNKFTIGKIRYDLIDTILTYIECVETGLTTYMNPSNINTLSYLYLIKKNEKLIFGNIQDILDFEKNILYPRLCDCNDDMQMIYDLFTKLLEEGLFYCYVVYAINSDKYKRIFEDNKSVIEQKERETKDQQSLAKLLEKPLTHIMKYHLFFDNISKNIESVDFKMDYLTLAERFKNLTHLVNKSMLLHDIKNCIDIDFLVQGKLLRVDTFEIKINEEKSFTGFVFLFEKRVIITETAKKQNNEIDFRLDLCCAVSKIRECDEKKIIISYKNQVVKLSHEKYGILSWKTAFTTAMKENVSKPPKISFKTIVDELFSNENIYILSLKLNFQYYFNQENDDMVDIKTIFKKIILFHETILIPELEKNRTKFKLLVKSFHNLFGPDIVNYYYKYSAFVSSAEKVLSQTTHEKSAIALGVKEFLNYPIGQIESYKNVFTTAIENYQGPGTENEDDGEYLAALAAMEVKMRELFKKIQEIKRVYAVDDANIFYANTGLICYYDSGMCNKHPSKIFLMEKQVIAMEVVGDAYTVIFQSFYKDIDAKNPLLGDKCSLKFELQNRKKNIFTFIFNPEKKQIFYTKFLDQKAKSK